jgi:hypothetical protein
MPEVAVGFITVIFYFNPFLMSIAPPTDAQANRKCDSYQSKKFT